MLLTNNEINFPFLETQILQFKDTAGTVRPGDESEYLVTDVVLWDYRHFIMLTITYWIRMGICSNLGGFHILEIDAMILQLRVRIYV